MRRAAVFCTVLGLIAASIGCRGVVTGTHDCTYDPATVENPPLNGKSTYNSAGPAVSGFIPPVEEIKPIKDPAKDKEPIKDKNGK